MLERGCYAKVVAGGWKRQGAVVLVRNCSDPYNVECLLVSDVGGVTPGCKYYCPSNYLKRLEGDTSVWDAMVALRNL